MQFQLIHTYIYIKYIDFIYEYKCINIYIYQYLSFLYFFFYLQPAFNSDTLQIFCIAQHAFPGCNLDMQVVLRICLVQGE